MVTWTTKIQDRAHSTMSNLTIKASPAIVNNGSHTDQLSPSTSESTYTNNTNLTPQNTQGSLQNNTTGSHTTIQQVLTPIKNNAPFGDVLTPAKPEKTVRIFYQNVNGIQKAKSWNEFNNLSKQLRSFQIDIWGATETNLKWNNARHQQAKNIIQKHCVLSALQTSSNKEECFSSYQPGGTATAIRNKLVGRITTTIQDKTNLGRWSGFKLNTNFGHQLNIITVYQSTRSEGIYTTYQQQAHYFRSQGIINPDPRKILMSDLTDLVSDFNRNKEETIVLIDANDNPLARNSLLSNFLSNTSLVSLIKNPQHHPATYTRGSQCIDFIFGSIRLLDHVQVSGISAFFEPPWPNTDHRGLFVDIDEIGLFGATLETIPLPIRRTITSKSKKQILKFIDTIHKTNVVDTLLTNLTNLQECATWTQLQHQQLEDIDVEFTKLLLDAESKCAIPTDFPWSPTLHQAFVIYQFWTTTYHGIRNNIDTSEQVSALQSQLPPDTVFQNNKSRSTIKQLRHARKTLINCRLRAQELREDYLELLQEIAIEQGNLSKSEAIRQLANRERQARCWRTFKMLRQGSSIQGGLSHILIPNTQNNNDSFQRIYEKEKIDECLLDRNIEHFSQADGTPFTVSPLIDILGEDGCSPIALQILEGNIPHNLPKIPTLLLQKLQRVRDPIPITFSLQDMCDGFSKWREKTTTSPSNKHLGIYKALIAADKHLSESSNPNEPKSSKIFTANKCLQIQHLLMTLAIDHCHTYQRWTTVHNFLIEKIPGIPRIDKLRVIHLYEADWSLIQKFFVAHKLNNLASQHKTVPVEQAGGRPGRSAIELAACRVFTFETMRLQRLSGAVLYNDAKACYDRVIENLSNMALMKQGLPLELAKLHSQTFTKIQYYIKHKLGIGNTPHSHRNPKPIYGVGQGSTDAPSRWGFVCDPLLEIYKELANDAIITSPLSTTTTNHKISGFVDDTTTLQIKHFTAMIYIILFLQHDAQTWERLLHTSGGKLEIQKCVFALFEWTSDHWGRPTLKKSTNNTLHIRNSDTQQIATIPQMATSEAYKYVGVQIAPDGNMTSQIKDLKKKCDDMASILSTTYFNASDANQGYTTVFAPSVKYVLPVTSISHSILQTMQTRTVSSVLSRLGFNRHMPRSVVFAPKKYGGIGLLNLPTEQGICQIQLLLSHLRSRSYLHDSIIILLESFQLSAGMQDSPLSITESYTHIHSPWIQSVRGFLRSMNATIYIPKLTQLTKHRVHDKPIMSAEPHQLSTSDIECVNACRIYLQVNFLSEICDNRGIQVLPQAIKGTLDSQGTPTLWTISQSTLQWPHQPRPPQKSWNIWKKYLRIITSPTFRVQVPLGDWVYTKQPQRTWTYTRHNNSLFSNQQHTPLSFTFTPTRSRHTVSYTLSNTDVEQSLEPRIPVIPSHITPTKVTCNVYTQEALVIPTRQVSDPSVTYKFNVLTQAQQASKITIAYHYTQFRTSTVTTARILLDDQPHVITYFHIPNSDNDSLLTLEAYACLIPVQYCKSFLYHHNTLHHIHVYCNTRQFKKRLILSASPHPSPTQTYLPDWDLTQTISNTLNTFHRMSIFHQTNESHSITKDYLSTITSVHTDTSTWSTATATYALPQLRIDNKRVSSDYTKALREKHTSPQILSYYSTKYEWDHTIYNDVCWNAHGKALTSLPRRMNKTITQFLHNWLPLNASHSINNLSTGKLCPFCTSCDEDHCHFLTCPHAKVNQLWLEAATTIKSKLASYDKQINHQLVRLIGHAIINWRNVKEPPLPEFLSPEFQALFRNQSLIGWNHILYGRFTKTWHNHLYDNQSDNVLWITYTIKAIWHSVYQIWKTRCQTNHGSSTDDQHKRKLLILEPKVKYLYDQQEELPSEEQYIFNINIEELLTKPITTIKTWVQKATLRIKCVKSRLKAKRRKVNLKSVHIHPFFTTRRFITPHPKKPKKTNIPKNEHTSFHFHYPHKFLP
jgi:hypothetical protein